MAIPEYMLCLNCRHEESKPMPYCPKCGESETTILLPYEEKNRAI